MDERKQTVLLNLASVIIGMMTLLIVFTMVMAGFFSVLSADDFSTANNMGVYNGTFREILKAALLYTNKMYFNWQGTFSSMFIEGLLNPIAGQGLPQLRVFMVLNTVLFFFVLFYFCYYSMRMIGISLPFRFSVIIVGLICGLLFGCDFYKEIFCWYTGSVEYLLTLSVWILGLILFVSVQDAGKYGIFVAAIVTGVIASSGLLMLSGAGVYLLLVIEGGCFAFNRKVSKRRIVVIASWLVSSMVATFSPGNFARRSVIDDTALKPFSAAWDSMGIVSWRLQRFYEHSPFIPIALLVLLVGIFAGLISKPEIEFPKMLVMVLLGALSPVVAIFPATLGTNISAADSIPNRYFFIIDFLIVVSMIALAFVLGLLISRVYEKSIGIVFLTVGIIMVTSFMSDGYGISDVRFLDAFVQVKNGTYKEYYESCCSLYDYLEGQPENEDVVVPAESVPKAFDNIFPFYLDEAPNYWVNSAVSVRYGLNSITVQNN